MTGGAGESICLVGNTTSGIGTAQNLVRTSGLGFWDIGDTWTYEFDEDF